MVGAKEKSQFVGFALRSDDLLELLKNKGSECLTRDSSNGSPCVWGIQEELCSRCQVIELFHGTLTDTVVESAIVVVLVKSVFVQ